MNRGKQLVFLRGDQSLDARAKAPKDVEMILSGEGYVPTYIDLKVQAPAYLRVPSLLYHIGRALASPTSNAALQRNGGIFVQYPVTSLFFKCSPLVKLKSCPISALIHDLESFRYTGSVSEEEISRLATFDHLIAHTPAMADLLSQGGIEQCRISVLHLFDYLLPAGSQPCALPFRQDRQRICFAGNLSKSAFLPQLSQITGEHLQVALYGVGLSEEVQLSEDLTFEGAFKPDDISSLSGHWELVWDGESIETCTGFIGSYLRINSPHKASLYLAAGIPLIVWNQAAIAPYIQEKGLGLAVESLKELPELLAGISPERYAEIRAAVLKEREQITTGQHLSTLLSQLG